jgi:hypothetical protein
MGFDSLGRYAPNHKSWDHVGNVIPVVEHSEGIRPHGEFKPAAWLPVQFFDKYYEEHFVVLPGKVLAFDNDGRVVPAQYAAGNIIYTAADVTAGTIDVRTGAALLTAAIGTFAVSSVDGTPGFLGRAGVVLAVSKPVGVAPYAMWQWAGDSSSLDDGFNPSAYRNHNHNLQHQVAILCDYVLELPLVPGATAAEAAGAETNASNVSSFAAVANLPVAANTVRTPITFGGAAATGNFLNQKDTAAEVLATGDWHIALATGVVSVYASSAINGGTTLTVSYSHYAAAPSSVSAFACAVGDLKAGDFVKSDANSNFVVAGGSDDFKDIVGQVLEIESAAKDALDKVRTAYNPAIGTDASGSLPGYAGQMDQMPGSATGGVSDKVHYAGAADLVVRINLVSR